MIEKLIILTPGFPHNESDTTCVPHLQNFIIGLKKLSPDLTIIVITISYPFSSKRYQWNGIEVVPCYSFLGKLAKWPRAIFNIIAETKKTTTIVHSFWLTEASFTAYIAKKIKSFAWIKTAMGQDVYTTNNYLKFIKTSQNDTVLLSSRSLAELNKSWGEKQRPIIPFGVEPIFENQTKSATVIGVGSLTELKNFSQFIEVAKLVCAEHHSARFIIAGEGPETAKLQDKIDHYDLNETVKLLGNLPRSEVLRLMSTSKVLLHTSRTEGQGYIFNEAISAKCYLVSTPVGQAEPTSDWATSSNTIEMAKAVLSFLNLNDLPKHPSQLSIEDNAKEMLAQYESILSNNA